MATTFVDILRKGLIGSGWAGLLVVLVAYSVGPGATSANEVDSVPRGNTEPQGEPFPSPCLAAYDRQLSFTGSGGQEESIPYTPAGFASYLHLIDPAGNAVVEDWSSWPGETVRTPTGFAALTLPSGGSYVIELSSYCVSGPQTPAFHRREPTSHLVDRGALVAQPQRPPVLKAADLMLVRERLGNRDIKTAVDGTGSISNTVSAEAPSNDNFDDAFVVPDIAYTNSQSTVGAGTESGEPLPCGDTGSTVWYRFTPSEDISLVADTGGSDYDTVLAVYTGSALETLTLIDCNDDAIGLQSRITFDATAGNTYHFQVGGFAGDVGNLTFNLGDASTLGSISGTVTDEGTGAPLAGICVDVFDTSFSWVGSGSTDSSGNYSAGGLATGNYKVRFWDCADRVYAFEWYDNKTTFVSADLVSATAGSDTPGIDAALTLGGSISGAVSEDGTGNPIEGAFVVVCPVAEFHCFGANTDSTGSYSIGGLAAGDYIVDASAGGFVAEYWTATGGTTDFSQAEPVAVVAGGDTSDINFSLAQGGSISGTVSEEGTGTPLADICVDAYDSAWNSVGSASTDASGSYSVGGLLTGDYKVQFRDCSFAPTHISEWYNDKPDFDSADLVSVTAGADTSGVDAALAMGGSISGTVIEEETGTPISDICVNVYDTSVNWVGADCTDFSGNYSAGGFPTGDYKIAFGLGHGTYISEWYNNKPDFELADLVSVVAGATTSGIDAALAVGGSISGTITEEGTGTPLPDIYIGVYDSCWNWMGSAYTDLFGNYAVGGLPTGDYKVKFEDWTGPYISEWYNDKSDCETADLVSVTAGSDTPGINAALAVGGSISGTVTDETGTPLSGICVDVYDTSGNLLGSGVTDASGAYVVSGLPARQYKIEFRDCSEAPSYISEWYNNEPDFELADLVSVVAGATTSGIDAALAVGGSISGTVTQEGTGTPLPDVCVSVVDSFWNWWGSGWSDFAGNYSVGGLPTGDYKVEFTDCSEDPAHITEWYNDKPDFDSADLVSVTAGSDTPGIDAALAVGGSISGTVTEEGTGTPLADVSVYVYEWSGAWCNWMGWANTDASGNYTVGGLPTGDYKVKFEDWTGPYISEWYNDKPDCETADLVSVTAGSDTAGIDADLAVGGSISGTVTEDGTGTPLPDICVNANQVSGPGYGFASTDGTGQYSVNGLPTGSYKIQFSDCSFPGPAIYVAEWYDDKPDFFSADPVSVTAGSTTAGIDAALAVGGSISGTVTDESDNPIQGAFMDASLFDPCCAFGSAETATDGTYTISGLPTGDYTVCADAPGFVRECWSSTGGTIDFSQAEPVSVIQGETTPNIDFVLAAGGTITGQVTDEQDNPIAGAFVDASLTDACCSFGSADTDSEGMYTIDGLATGSYQVCVFNHPFLQQCKDDVGVVQGETTSNVNFTLLLGGMITGRVTDEAGNPIAGASVSASQFVGCCQGGFAETDPDGTYTIEGLPTDDYRVSAGAPGFAGECYNDDPECIYSTAVHVVQGQTTSDIDFQLGEPGQIAGTVADPAGQPISGASVCAIRVHGFLDFFFGACGETESDGTYVIDGLGPGAYRVSASAPGFVGECYDDALDCTAATPVPVTDGQTTSGIDLSLGTSGKISGQVTDQAGNPIEGAFVRADLMSGCCITGWASTGPDGTYVIEDNLAAGTFRVFADAEGRGGECYNNVADCSAATLVPVASGELTPGIDFSLGPGGSISGRVTDEAGNPVWGAAVAAVSYVSCCEVELGFTDSDGTYRIEDLASGDFLVVADAGGMAGEYYNDTTDPSSATPVAVTALGETLGVDFVLAPDTDEDGITDAVEGATGTSPTDADSDDDGLCDGAPVQILLKGPTAVCSGITALTPPATFKFGGEDVDGDGLVDLGETDPRDGDSDDDGLSDGLELGLSFRAHWDSDTRSSNFQIDRDPLTTTDPLDPDTDRDRIPLEVVWDGDRLLDGEEDANHNGRVDEGETDPNNPDTDGDGVGDGQEVFENSSDPLDATSRCLVFLDFFTINWVVEIGDIVEVKSKWNIDHYYKNLDGFLGTGLVEIGDIVEVKSEWNTATGCLWAAPP